MLVGFVSLLSTLKFHEQIVDSNFSMTILFAHIDEVM